MRTHFVERVIRGILEADPTAAAAQWLAICAGLAERDTFLKLGLKNATISNFDSRMRESEVTPFAWSTQDAHQLAYRAKAFDYVFVSDGLHHCSSPHRALLEMYRVCRKAIVVIESRDSILMRLAEAMGLTARYELDAVVGNDFAFGGVDNSPVPNFVYRWTEREFAKTINAFDPTSKHRFRFFYDLNLPERTGRMQTFLRVIGPTLRLATRLFPRQCNSFAMVAYRPTPDDLWPWLRHDGERVIFRRDYAV